MVKLEKKKGKKEKEGEFKTGIEQWFENSEFIIDRFIHSFAETQ